MAKTVLVTGGSGFLGHHVVNLICSKWKEIKEIRIFDPQPPKDLPINYRNGTHYQGNIVHFPGSILDQSELMKACESVDIVIHCAALVENGSIFARKHMYSINVTGTSNVIEACIASGVKVLVATGSMYQYLSKGCNIINADESISPTPMNKMLYPDYSFSKMAAEELVLKANGRKSTHNSNVRLRTCVLRCTGMYGEGDKTFITKAMNNFVYNYYVRNDRNKIQITYVGNAAWGHVLAAQSLFDEAMAEKLAGKPYFLGDHTPNYTGTEMMGSFLDPMGYKCLPFAIPLVFFLLIGYIMDAIAFVLALLKIDVHVIGVAAVWSIHIDYTFSNIRAQRDFNFKPLFSHEEALQRSIQYYKQFKK